MSSEPAPDPLAEAEELLDAGDLVGALRRVEELDPAEPQRWLLAAEAWTDLGELANAEAALARAAELGDEGSWWTFLRGRWLLASWRAEEARATLERLDPAVEGPSLLELLALAADLQGDHEAADRFFQAASALDPDAVPPPPRLSPEAFHARIRTAAEDLPPEFRAALEETAVVLDPMPTAALVQAPESGHPPDLLGLFVGPTLHEREASSGGELPPTIYLFQRNLERLARDEEELTQEIRVTLYHELGHALGFDEDGVDALGLA